MSGLDSIALAVALLDQQQQKSTTEWSAPARPVPAAPIPERSNQALRIVSTEAAASGHYGVPPKRAIQKDIVVNTKPPHAVIPYLTNVPMNIRGIPANAAMDGWFYDPRKLHSYLFSLDLSELATIPVPDTKQPILTPRDHVDVKLGRGGESNNNPGNIKYRHYVKTLQSAYMECKRRDKPLIAQRVVLAVRKNNGRFLRKDDSGKWFEVGNIKAREKTSQALREGAPDLRPQDNSVVTSESVVQSIKPQSSPNKKRRAISDPSTSVAASFPVPSKHCCQLPTMPYTHMIAAGSLWNPPVVVAGGALPQCYNGGPRIKLLKKRSEEHTQA
jgi:hypothetical protein